MSKPITIIIQKAENGFSLNVHISAERQQPYKNIALVATGPKELRNAVNGVLEKIYPELKKAKR